MEDGRFGEPVAFEVSDDDYGDLIGVWRRIKTMKAGPARSQLVKELRMMLDLHALLDATGVDRPSAELESVIERARAAQGLSQDGQTSLFAPPKEPRRKAKPLAAAARDFG